MKIDWYEMTTVTRFNPILAGAALTIAWLALGIWIGKLIWGG
jgi:hypothetical protein